MRSRAHLRSAVLHRETVVDEDGVVLRDELKQHKYLADSKEEFLFLYSSILGIFNKMEQSEIRVFSFLLRYADSTPFGVGKEIRLEIAKVTGLNERTIQNTVKVLESKDLIFKSDSGAYRINPRYAFKGSTSDRNQHLKFFLEVGCIG